jgi:lysozyme family protein
MLDFTGIVERVLTSEGGYVNDPDDPGKETIWGLTVAVARANGYAGDMRAMPRATAVAVYQDVYWKRPGYDRLWPVLGYQVFDAAVNHGVVTASKMLQTVAKVDADGVVGPQTMAALSRIPMAATVLGMIGQRARKYAMTDTVGHFGAGWMNRLAALALYAASDITDGSGPPLTGAL